MRCKKKCLNQEFSAACCPDSLGPAARAALGAVVVAADAPAAQAVPQDAMRGDPLVADSGAVPVQS